MALVSLRALDRCISETIKYTGERVVKGKPLLENQVVYFTLSELATEVEALRAITYQAVGKNHKEQRSFSYAFTGESTSLVNRFLSSRCHW